MIQVLSKETIDKIAAGEVVERPASCIKELCENSIDAGAGRINVEIKGGGIELIRVSDDGCGIPAGELKTAFLRHATSKITDIKDLESLASLGFRGEALSSIAAVSRLEIITKTKDTLIASRYRIEGGAEGDLDEVGAPDGTTFIIKDMFFNTPVRRKFLKTASTEGAYCAQVIEHLALSHPEIAFSFISNGRTTLQTWGRGDQRDVIHQIYGKEISSQLIKLPEGMLSGYLAKPVVARNGRNMELFFVNGRYIRYSKVLSKALEDAYAPYLMQHKFPFAVLNLQLDGSQVDANIHPQKLEVRFSDNERIYDLVYDALSSVLGGEELIPRATLDDVKEADVRNVSKPTAPTTGAVGGKICSPGQRRGEQEQEPSPAQEKIVVPAMEDIALPILQREDGAGSPEREVAETVPGNELPFAGTEEKIAAEEKDEFKNETLKRYKAALPFETQRILREEARYEEKRAREEKAGQLDLFEERILTREAVSEYRFIGQVFDTYWIIQHRDRMLLIDQHAAHEKVLYERFMAQIRDSEVYSQQLMPPLVVSLTATQEQALSEGMEYFTQVGFEIEPYGGRDFCIRAVPEKLSTLNSSELFIEMLDDLVENGFSRGGSEMIKDRIATMACKAAVKGNNRLTEREAVTLVDELLGLENPYNCPHGRPTMIVMSKNELEKKFKR